MTHFLLCLPTAGCFLLSVGQRSSRRKQCSVFQANNDKFYCWPWQCPLLPLWEEEAELVFSCCLTSLSLFLAMFCWSQLTMENLIVLSNFLYFFSHTFCEIFAQSLPFLLIFCSLSVRLQRDLDFTFELDFKGQLCEAAISHDYKMR